MFFIKKIKILFLVPVFAFSLNYDVKFSGIKDSATKLAIENVSNLIILKKRPPKTINALRYRANNDEKAILMVLQSYGYYDATISFDFEEKKSSILVHVYISTGTRYTIKDIQVFYDCVEKKKLDINYNDLNLKINDPLVTYQILSAESKLLFSLSRIGYPFAHIQNREIKIDLADKNATLLWCVDQGPFSKFGPIRITGLRDVNTSYIYKKIKWKKYETYDIQKVILTQANLLRTNLFSSVAITNDDKLDENNLLPMNLKFIEALHKYFSTGISYATIDGFGISFNWGNRNFRSLGELLAIETEIAQRLFTGIATYKKPDFLKIDQDYVLRLQAEREKIPYVYLAFKYSMNNRIDRYFSNKLMLSCGFKIEYNEITHSANNGDFFLLSLPIYLKYSTTNNLLNPTQGNMLIYRITPFQEVIKNKDFFLKQTLLYNFYLPCDKSRILVLAFRGQIGSIIGPKVYRIPLTKLFLGGSDDDLRGYRFRTVSPMNEKDDPIGGRSAVYFSIEPRLRISEKFGLVPFSDFGVISLKQYPDINKKWYKSVGIGLRYFSFFGPLRLDVGFPLDRRKKFDSKYKIYGSIGQTF